MYHPWCIIRHPLYPYLYLHTRLQSVIETPMEIQKRVQFTTTSVGFQQTQSFWGFLNHLSATISNFRNLHLQPPPFEWWKPLSNRHFSRFILLNHSCSRVPSLVLGGWHYWSSSIPPSNWGKPPAVGADAGFFWRIFWWRWTSVVNGHRVYWLSYVSHIRPYFSGL